MKYILTFLLFICAFTAFSQSISRKVLPTTGGSYSDSNINMSYTIGETFTTTLSNATTIATQGFQQPDNLEPITATITANGATTFCQGNSVTLNANTGINYSYQWLLNGSAIAGATNNNYVAIQSGSYSVRITNATNFFKISAQITVVVNSLPIVGSSISPSSNVCPGTQVTLTGNGASSYAWTGGITNATSFPASATNTYTVTGTDANGCSATSTIQLSVKPQPSVTTVSNQTYCNGQTVAAIPLTGLPLGVSFDIAGGVARGLPNQTNVTAIPSFTTTSAGSSVISITPKANGCVGPVSTYTMTVSNCPPVTLNLKFYIQGYYQGAGFMQPVLFNEGESSDPNSIQTDYVIVELHAATPPYAMVKTTIALLKTNGTLICNFNGSVTNTPYYIVIHHRNSIVTWSANPVIITQNTTYDFSNVAEKAYGSNQTDVSGNGSIWAFYNADINQDDNIDLIDLGSLESDISEYLFGYITSDINGDGNVDLLDIPVLENNLNNFIFSQHP